MIKINLLPSHLRPIKRTPVPHVLSVAVLAGAVVYMAISYMTLEGEIAAKADHSAQLESELAELRPYVEEANQLASQKQLLADRIEAIDEIVSDRIIWSRQLHNLARLAPEDFWYSGITVDTRQFRERQTTRDPESGEYEIEEVTVRRPILEVSGYVLREGGSADVSQLMHAAEQDPEFARMFELEAPTFSDTTFEEYDVRHFTLEFLIQQGEPTDD
ncbi:MAG: PilN domain-containing protein [Candidatus Hydrogenedentota bacterium]